MNRWVRRGEIARKCGQNNEAARGLLGGRYWAELFQAILLVPVGFVFCYYAWRIVQVKTTILVPMIGAIMITGIYSLRGEPLDVIVAVGFGITAWLMQKTDFPPLNFVIGVLLGRILEGEIVRTYATFNGRWELLLQRPIFLILIVAFLAMLLLTIRSERRRVVSERELLVRLGDREMAQKA